jgi:hypothetical protein
MTTCPPLVSPTPALTDEATLSAALECLKAHLPVMMQGEYQPETLYEVLLWTASHHDSIEHAAQQLTGVPTGNDLRYHLDKFEGVLRFLCKFRLWEREIRGFSPVIHDLLNTPRFCSTP